MSAFSSSAFSPAFDTTIAVSPAVLDPRQLAVMGIGYGAESSARIGVFVNVWAIGFWVDRFTYALNLYRKVRITLER